MRRKIDLPEEDDIRLVPPQEDDIRIALPEEDDIYAVFPGEDDIRIDLTEEPEDVGEYLISSDPEDYDQPHILLDEGFKLSEDGSCDPAVFGAEGAGTREERSRKEKRKEQRRSPADRTDGRWQSSAEQKEAKRARRRDRRPILVMTYLFLLLFLGMIGYLVYFTQKLAPVYRANEYNAKRQAVFADRYIRGDILSGDGEILATSTVGEDGKERRVYPFRNVYAHAVGYSTYGSTGAEALAGTELLSSRADILTQIRSELTGEKLKGLTAVTTLDSRLQQAAYDALGDRQGAVVVLEVKTGKILAMVSKPDYDPNEIADIWDELTSDSSRSNLVNRAAQGLYPPGSTFKLIPLLEYIREDPDAGAGFRFDCSSIFEYGEYTISCSKKIAHGEEDLKAAFANSCNGAFARIGLTLDVRSLAALCETFGYNRSLPVDFYSNTSRFTLEKDSGTFALLQSSIGQGETLITPLHNAMIAQAVAAGGTMMRPYLLDRIQTSEGTVVKQYGASRWTAVMSPAEAALLQEYMRAVVTEGTGAGAEGDGSYTAAGKTGSAEWASGKDTHAWFIGYAPAEKPEIAVSVLLEQGGSGGSAAAPVAAAVFDTYFQQDP